MECQIPICNKRAIEETNELKINWIAGKQVGHCISFHQQKVMDLLEEDITGPNSTTSKPKGRKREYGKTADEQQGPM